MSTAEKVDKEEFCTYLTDLGVCETDIQRIQDSPLPAEKILNSSSEELEAVGLSGSCIAKLSSLVHYSEYLLAQREKAKQRRAERMQSPDANFLLQPFSSTGPIVYHSAQETQEAVVDFGRDSSPYAVNETDGIVYRESRETQMVEIEFKE